MVDVKHSDVSSVAWEKATKTHFVSSQKHRRWLLLEILG